MVERAEAIEPIKMVLRTSEMNMHIAVKYTSGSVCGSTSYGIIAVTIPAPQKKDAANCWPKESWSSWEWGCQLFGCNGSPATRSS